MLGFLSNINPNKTPVRLEKIKDSYKKEIARLLNNRNIWNNLSNNIPFPYSEDDAAAFIKNVRENPRQIVFGIEYKERFCGLISLELQKDIYQKSAELGYWIGEDFWGKGIATAAIEKMIRYAFENHDIIRIFARVFEYNRASMRVLEKNGFKKECIARKAIYKNGKLWDEHRFFLLKTDKI